LAINALTYLTSQLSIASVASFGPEAPSGFPKAGKIARDVAAGWRFVMADRVMRTLSLSQMGINTVAILGFVAMIPYLKREFAASDQTVGIVFGCFALGSVAGSVVAGRTHWPFGRALLICYLIDAVSWLPTIWARSLPLAVGAVTICAACGAYQVTAIVSWRMRVIPEEIVGRVFGVIRLLIIIGMFPGSLLRGVLADRLGTRPVMAVSGFAFLAITVGLASSRVVRSERR
jgi:MFS family permease